ncbi:hypothetical protein SAMN05880590_10178 [Rhizobium sp. RU35A]|uniref:hypothetical protein n=1 Tax=Rhizobium sp. RU35A TaxID=1907414 RepID=UPI000953DCE1|nr:hypothetical protein [Rhizobium sp. RU35A]SIP89879.1 hypothetical protein SAMN05880590_10178 [Rhizobium sp. RU35A]
MDFDHTLDPSRLRALDAIRENLKASSQALSEKVRTLTKKRIDKNTQLNAAKAALRGARSGGAIVEHHFDGGIPTSITRFQSSDHVMSWTSKVERLEAELADINREITAANDAAAAASSRFSEADGLCQSCTKFLDDRFQISVAEDVERQQLNREGGQAND